MDGKSLKIFDQNVNENGPNAKGAPEDLMHDYSIRIPEGE